MSDIIQVTDSKIIDTLSGTEKCYQFPMGYRNFNIQNLGDASIYASLDSDMMTRSYGVTEILPGAAVNIENRYIEDNRRLYITGTGKVQITGLNYSEMTYSKPGGDGFVSPGGGGEGNVIESVKVNGTALPVGIDKSVNIEVPTKVSQLTNDSGYIKSAPIESVKVNSTAVSIDSDKSVNIIVPTKVSELSNDSGYIKTIPDEYATKIYVGEQIANVDHLSREIVETLPTDDVAEENVIYMIKVDDASGNDKYREYQKINGTLQLVGDTSVDLTGYAKLTDIPTELPANGGNADTVNNHTVGTDVPADAVFTDTVYTLPTASTEILGGVKVDGTTISADANGVISAAGGGSGGDDNVIESIKVNGVEQTINADKSVDITVPTPPTKTSELENDSGYITSADIPTSLPANGGNADTVNNHTVNTDVPENAVFTDTIYTLPTATDSVLGGIKSGNDISVFSEGTVTVNSVNGKTVGVDVPSDAKFTDTVYTLPMATADTLGGVKIDGDTITIASDGTISATREGSSGQKSNANIQLPFNITGLIQL